MRGLLKRWPAQQPSDKRGVPFEVDSDLANIAHLAGKALSLEIYGVDILHGPHGSTIIDVNPFPGFRGITDAAELIAGHIMATAEGYARNAG